MSIIFGKINWKEESPITKGNLINLKYYCDIYINEKKLVGNMTIDGEKNIIYTDNYYT